LNLLHYHTKEAGVDVPKLPGWDVIKGNYTPPRAEWDLTQGPVYTPWHEISLSSRRAAEKLLEEVPFYLGNVGNLLERIRSGADIHEGAYRNALEELNFVRDYPSFQIPSGLHEQLEKMRVKLQESLPPEGTSSDPPSPVRPPVKMDPSYAEGKHWSEGGDWRGGEDWLEDRENNRVFGFPLPPNRHESVFIESGEGTHPYDLSEETHRMQKFLGLSEKENPLQVISDLCGAGLAGQEILLSLEPLSEGNGIKVEGFGDGIREAATIIRKNAKGDLTIESPVLKFDPGSQGQGLAMRLVLGQITAAVAMGVKSAKCYAQCDEREEWVGCKVWPKMGYDGLVGLDDLEDPDELEKRLKAAGVDTSRGSVLVSQIRALQDPADSGEKHSWGERYWHDNGISFAGTLDLNEGSPGLDVLKKYVQRKRAHNRP
jgi:hypothetical protein